MYEKASVDADFVKEVHKAITTRTYTYRSEYQKDTFDFMNYKNYVMDNTDIDTVLNELNKNPEYVAAGFANNWTDNRENKPIKERIYNEDIDITYSNNKTTMKLPENLNDTEYGEVYTVKGENDFLYTTLPNGKYSFWETFVCVSA